MTWIESPVMLITRILFFCYIIYKILLNLALLPYYFLLDRRVFWSRLRVWVDEVINLEMWFDSRFVSISLQQLHELLGRVTPHPYVLFSSRPSNINLLECLTIGYIVQATAASKIFEIGTFDGFSTYHLAKNSPESAIIYTLNLPPGQETGPASGQFVGLDSYEDELTHNALPERGLGSIYKSSDAAAKVVQLFGDSTTFDYSPYLSKIDLVFVDGGHSYDVVKSDTENAVKLLSDRGIILWHDFNVQHYDIHLYLRRFAREHKLFCIQGTRLGLYMKRSSET